VNIDGQAALVMATTHSILRGDAPGLESPDTTLERANDRLYPDIPLVTLERTTSPYSTVTVRGVASGQCGAETGRTNVAVHTS
jgi:hypothetical protein